MDKRTAKKKVAKVLAKQLRVNRVHIYKDHDGDGKPVSAADQKRLSDAYDGLLTFLEAKANGSPTARW